MDLYSGLCDYCGINKGWAGNIEEISPPLLRSAVWLFSNMAERRDPQRNPSAESQRFYTFNTLNTCAGHRPRWPKDSRSFNTTYKALKLPPHVKALLFQGWIPARPLPATYGSPPSGMCHRWRSDFSCFTWTYPWQQSSWIFTYLPG